MSSYFEKVGVVTGTVSLIKRKFDNLISAVRSTSKYASMNLKGSKEEDKIDKCSVVDLYHYSMYGGSGSTL